MKPIHNEETLELFIVNGQSTDQLYFYFFQDEFAAVKCHVQQGCPQKGSAAAVPDHS